MSSHDNNLLYFVRANKSLCQLFCFSSDHLILVPVLLPHLILMLATMFTTWSARSLVLLCLVLLLENRILAFVLYIGQFLCIKTLRVPLLSFGRALLLVYYCIIMDHCKSEGCHINCLLIVAAYNFLHLWR